MKNIIATLPFLGAAALAVSLGALPAKASETDTPMFHSTIFQIDGADNRAGGLITWEGQGWYGGDTDKFVVRTRGDMQNGHVESSELWGLWSHMISDFWDLQAGVRQDFDPRPTSSLAVGLQGVLPQFIETDVHAFLSTRGDLSARLEQSIELHMTQRLILQPHVQMDIYASDVPELYIGSGISRIETGLQFRYEIRREVAPYLDLVYETATGNTAHIKRANGEKAGELTLRAGIRFAF